MRVHLNSDGEPAPGIYHNVPFNEYLSWPAISNSRLNQARRSLAHYKANVGQDQTKALMMGSLVHCGRLEPMAVAKRYAVMPRFEDHEENLTAKGEKPNNPKATSYYRRKVEEFMQVNCDKEIVTESQFDEMVEIVRSLARHGLARKWVEAEGPVELTVVWNDEETGLLCKARIDKLVKEESLVCDLKTYAPQHGYLSPAEKFGRSIATFGYHRQMAHYLAGVNAMMPGTHWRCGLIVVETAKPYCVMAAPMSEDWLQFGRSEVAETMRAIANAKATHEWPGYESPNMWMPPAWYGEQGELELRIGGESVSL